MGKNTSEKQLDKFKKAAREAECNPSEMDFDQAIGKLAKPDAQKKEASKPKK